MRVLVVDDEVRLRSAVRVMLADTGIEVSEAADGDEAIQRIEQERPDVVLCDVFMPSRDGLEVLRYLLPVSSGVRVVAMSGGGDFHGPVNLLPVAKALGAVAVLHKPFTKVELLAAIRLFPLDLTLPTRTTGAMGD